LADDFLEDLEPPFEPFAPFFAAVAMRMVLANAPVILERADDRTAPLNHNLIHKGVDELFRGFFTPAAKERVPFSRECGERWLGRVWEHAAKSITMTHLQLRTHDRHATNFPVSASTASGA
jgi:hypothetical protein